MPALLPLPLRSHPDLPGYEFYVVAGTVLAQAAHYREAGRYPPRGVPRKVNHWREFVVRQEDGTEVKLAADANQVQLQEGHRVTLVVAGAGHGYDCVMRLWNHDEPRYSGVVPSAVRTIAWVPEGNGCLGTFLLAVGGAKAFLFVVGLLLGWAAGGLAAGLFLVVFLTRSYKGRRRRLRRLKAKRDGLIEHLSLIGQALSLPPGGGEAAGPRHR